MLSMDEIIQSTLDQMTLSQLFLLQKIYGKVHQDIENKCRKPKIPTFIHTTQGCL